MELLKNKKENNLTVVKWIFKRTKKYIPCVILISVLSAITALGFVALACVSKLVLDIATGDSQGSILLCGIILLSIVILQIVLSGVQSILRTHTNARITIALRNSIFDVVARRRYSEISGYHSGELLNRTTSDVNVIVTSVVNTIPSVVAMTVQLIGGISAIFILDKKIGLIILLLGILIPTVGRIFNRKFKELHKKEQITEGESRSFIQECFGNLVIIKTFVSCLPFISKLSTYFEANYKVKMKKSLVSVFTHLGLYSFFTIGYYCVLIWGADSISRGIITYGTLMAFLQLVSQLRAPLQNFSGIIPQYFSALASSERIMELESGNYDKEPIDNQKLSEIKEQFKFLSVKNVDFAYLNEAVLKNCSFTVPKGEITAITGESGIGKSTVFKLILSLFESHSGSITINGEIPIDASLRGLFAYVPQGNMLISGSIRENISLYRNDITEEEIINAIKIAQLEELIASVPDGLDTKLSERGEGLSEGQIQRISIARAVLTDAPILLLDEATSALDEETEAKVLTNIKNMKNKTVLFVTHRKAGLKICDNIFHMFDGKLEKIK